MKLQCYYTNADSLLYNVDELTPVTDLLTPDIIMITEALPKNVQTPVQLSEMKTDGYHIHTNLEDPSCSKGVCLH